MMRLVKDTYLDFKDITSLGSCILLEVWNMELHWRMQWVGAVMSRARARARTDPNLLAHCVDV